MLQLARTLHRPVLLAARKLPGTHYAAPFARLSARTMAIAPSQPTPPPVESGQRVVNKDNKAKETIHYRQGVPETQEEHDYVMFHPVYKERELEEVRITHKPVKTVRDRIGYSAVSLLRFGFDLATGYKHDPLASKDGMTPALDGSRLTPEEREKLSAASMTEKQWLRRFIFVAHCTDDLALTCVAGDYRGRARHAGRSAGTQVIPSTG